MKWLPLITLLFSLNSNSELQTSSSAKAQQPHSNNTNNNNSPDIKALKPTNGAKIISLHPGPNNSNDSHPIVKTNHSDNLIHFFKLVSERDFEGLNDFLSDKPKNFINTRYFDGDTALHKAISKKDQSMSRFLLRKKANPNIKNKELNSSFHIAIWNDQYNLVKEMVRSQPVNWNLADKNNDTLFHTAARLGRSDILIFLLESLETDFLNGHLSSETKNILNYKNDRLKTALQIAVERSDVLAVSKLLEHGLEIHTTDHPRQTPWNQALERGSYPVINLLLKYTNTTHLKKILKDIHTQKTRFTSPPFYEDYYSTLVYLFEKTLKKQGASDRYFQSQTQTKNQRFNNNTETCRNGFRSKTHASKINSRALSQRKKQNNKNRNRNNP